MQNVLAIFKNQAACDQVEKLSIVTALQRNWTIPHRCIDVAVADNKVTLSGTVHTKHAYIEAEKIATQTPGVFSVCNNMLLTEER
jgi:osmotically-inducible protein OsmY